MPNSTNSKKSKVLATKKKAIPLKFIVPSAIIVISAIIVAVVVVTGQGSGKSRAATAISSRETFTGSARTRGQSPNNNSTAIEGGSVKLNAADFSDGKAKYYSVDVAGNAVRFFVLKSSDGVIRSAFDACDVCYMAKKGYRQAGDLMICNNCGQQFPSERINIEKGGCNPSPLERQIEGESVIITRADIEKGVIYF